MSGGVYLNIGSVVIVTEVFPKEFTIAQNLGVDLRDNVTVNIDMISHHRSAENVVRRPASVAGRGYNIVGRHEILLPIQAQGVVDLLD